MGLRELEIKKEEMSDAYFDLIDEIEEFLRQPTRGNRRIVLEKSRIMSNKKNSLIHNIRDYWCKGE